MYFASIFKRFFFKYAIEVYIFKILHVTLIEFETLQLACYELKNSIFSLLEKSPVWPTFENTHASKESVMCRMYFQKKDIYETQPAFLPCPLSSFVFIECCTLLLTLFTYHHRAPISSFAEKRLRQQQCIIETWDERLEIALSMSTLSKNWSFDRQTPYFQRKVLLKVNLMVYFSSSSPK